MPVRRVLLLIAACTVLLLNEAAAWAQFSGMGGPGGGGMGGPGGAGMPPRPANTGDTPKSKWFRRPSWLGGPDEKLAKGLYEEGEQLFQQAKDADQTKPETKELYRVAAKKLSSAATRAADSPLEEEALFLYAEAQFFCDQYPGANDSYALLLKKFPNSRFLQRAVGHQFLIARYWEKLNNYKYLPTLVPNLTDKTRPWIDTGGNAQAVYRTIQTNDPTGPLTDDALMATANAYFLNGNYDEASYYYSRLRKEHPRSEHQPTAHLLGIRSDLRRYQGPRYDGTPLVETDKLVKASLYQFPTELSNERENILKAQEAVRAQHAQRDFEMGEYYYASKHYGAARFYYDTVMKEFSDTLFAVKARQRLEEIQDKPDNPAVKFPWLIKVFEKKRYRI